MRATAGRGAEMGDLLGMPARPGGRCTCAAAAATCARLPVPVLAAAAAELASCGTGLGAGKWLTSCPPAYGALPNWSLRQAVRATRPGCLAHPPLPSPASVLPSPSSGTFEQALPGLALRCFALLSRSCLLFFLHSLCQPLALALAPRLPPRPLPVPMPPAPPPSPPPSACQLQRGLPQ